jgi:glycosyltransferase involved in cell wall biosynthesis/tetratricopeptide (TPR) repeat protein
MSSPRKSEKTSLSKSAPNGHFLQNRPFAKEASLWPRLRRRFLADLKRGKATLVDTAARHVPPALAERIMEQALRIMPNSPKLLVVSAKLSMRSGNNLKALSALRNALEVDPENDAVRMTVIKGLTNLGDFAEGEITATQILKKMPDNITFLEMRASCREGLGKESEATEDWRSIAAACEAALQEKAEPGLYQAGGAALLKIKKLAAAEALLLDGLKNFPEQTELCNLLALCYAAQGRKCDALRVWQEALARNPQNTGVATALISHMMRWGGSPQTGSRRPREGIALVESLCPVDPVVKTVAVLLDRGQEAALEAWQTQRDLLASNLPGYIKILGNLFRALRQIDQPELLVAIGDREDLISRNPVPSASQRRLINLYLRCLLAQHQTAKVREILTAEGYSRPSSEEEQVLFAELLFAEKKIEECLTCAQRVAKQFPRSFGAHRMVVRGLVGKRDHAAVEDYIAMLEEHGVMDRTQLGRLAETAGQVELAERYFKCALRPHDLNAIKAYTGFLQKTGRWKSILELGSRYSAAFNSDWYLESTLEEVRELSETLRFDSEQEEQTDRASSALVAVYEEILRKAPKAVCSTRARRLAMVIGTLGPGGAERQCAILCQQLARCAKEGRIAEVRVFVGNLTQNSRNGVRRESIESAGVPVIEYYSRAKRVSAHDVIEDRETADLMMSFQPSIRRQTVLQLYEHLRGFNPDIVHAWLDSAIYVSGLVSALLPRARFVGRWGSLPPTVQRVSSPQERNHAAVLRRVYKSLIEQSTVQFYSNAQPLSDFYADWIGVDRSKILTVKNGIEFSSLQKSAEARQRIRESLEIPPNAVVIGATIRCGSEKRPFMWLDVAERVAAQRPGTAFIIVGDGPLLDDVRRRAKTLTHAKVHVVGRQMNISDWYNAMDITLMTSSVEGLSNTVLESAYMRLPVVSFEVGGMAEAVINRETGLLLPEKDIDGVVHALIRLIDHPDMRIGLGVNAQKYAAENFHPESMCNSVLAIYDELLGR